MPSYSQVKCVTCSLAFTSNDIIYGSLECGHVYHQKCLYNKFREGFRTCGSSNGNCKAICYPRKCRRIYLNFNSFKWLHIQPEVFCHNAKELQEKLLSLGTNRNSHEIYAARVFLPNTFTAVHCYYNATTGGIYKDFECDYECQSRQFEFLDISEDKDYQYEWSDTNETSSSSQETIGGYFKNDQKLIRIPRKS